jgi:hypothetical protein
MTSWMVIVHNGFIGVGTLGGMGVMESLQHVCPSMMSGNDMCNGPYGNIVRKGITCTHLLHRDIENVSNWLY